MAQSPLEPTVDETEGEQALLERVRNGDPRAVEALLACYAGQIDRFAADLCGANEDAHDVRQQTLLAAFRGLSMFRGESSVATWLFHIARSFCIKMRRRRTGEPLDWEFLDATALNQPGDEAETPSSLVQHKELIEALRTVLSHLPSSYLQVLQLKDVEGLSVAETARLLGESVAATKSRLVRARGELRRALRSSPQIHMSGF